MANETYPTGNEFDDMCEALNTSAKPLTEKAVYRPKRQGTEVIDLQSRGKSYDQKVEEQADDIFGPQ